MVQMCGKTREYMGMRYWYTVCATDDSGLEAIAGLNFKLGNGNEYRHILPKKQFNSFEEAEESTEDSARAMIDNFYKTGIFYEQRKD